MTDGNHFRPLSFVAKKKVVSYILEVALRAHLASSAHALIYGRLKQKVLIYIIIKLSFNIVSRLITKSLSFFFLIKIVEINFLSLKKLVLTQIIQLGSYEEYSKLLTDNDG